MITAQQVKELREKTNAPMMDCKNALTEAQGDMGQAEVILRKRGIATAAKKAGRTAQEGLVEVLVNGEAAALVEVNCESDFVARTPDFVRFVNHCAAQVRDKMKHVDSDRSKAEYVEELLNLPGPGMSLSVTEGITPRQEAEARERNSSNIREEIGALVGKLGENIVIRRVVRYKVPSENHWIDWYVHHGKIGVLVEAETDKPKSPEFHVVMRDLAMHVAASDPQCTNREQVDPAKLASEKEIQMARARTEGKPEKILEKIVEGRLGKFYEEICLLEQPFIRETNMSVGQWLASKAGDIGNVSVTRFTRFKVGEGVA